jgi:pentatricopeptide repeat protein
MYLCYDDYQFAGSVFYMALISRALSWKFVIELLIDKEKNPYGLLLVFRELHRLKIRFNVGFLVSILKISSELNELNLGFSIHAFLVKFGFSDETFLRCSLMELYANCNSVDSSYNLFYEATIKDPVLWNRLIALYVEKKLDSQSLQLYNEMHYFGITGDPITLSKVLHACGKVEALREGEAIHAQTVKSGLFDNSLVSNSLITMYSKNFSIDTARKVFELIEDKSVISWNSIISSCSQNGFLDEASELLDCMVKAGLKPDLVTWNSILSGYSHNGHDHKVFKVLRSIVGNRFKVNSNTISSVLRSINNLRSLRYGKEIHGYVVRHGFTSNVYIGTSLVDMYMKCGSLNSSQRAFDSMEKRNVHTWNALISGYIQIAQFGKALELIRKMEDKGFKPNISTWNTLISGYAMQGLSKQAMILVRRIKSDGLKPNVISWTALISGFCQKGDYGEALYVLSEMIKEGIEPNSTTVTVLLGAYAALPSLTKGMELHCFAIRRVFDRHTYVGTALVDMYSKSGSLRNACSVFKRITNKNAISWNVIIMGFATHGCGQESIRLFEEMLKSGVLPNSVTFTALLSGCRHSGLIDEAWKYFHQMQTSYNISPTVEHYTCMIDLLAKKGYLDEALDLVRKMPMEPDMSVWGAILNGSKIHKNLELAETAASKLYQLEPHNPAIYFMMISMYANENQWDEVEDIKMTMSALGLKSRYGWCWIELNKKVHIFYVEGSAHPEMREIKHKLDWLLHEISKMGYVPDTSVVSQNLEFDEKVQLLMGHTEKLAITYGLVRSNSTGPIRVVKSTRVCNDCHAWAKYLSRLCGRQIFIKDSVRFHHFVNGECSCTDFW